MMISKKLLGCLAFVLFFSLANTSFGQALTYKGYSKSGTLYGCASAPSGWGYGATSVTGEKGQHRDALRF